MKREDKNPLQIVAVTGVVIKDDKFLAGQRDLNDADWPGKWCLPGGKVEIGETLEVALRQEILEESGVEIENIFYVDNLFSKDSDGNPFLLIFFGCEYKSGEIKAGDDMISMEWMRLEDFSTKDFINKDDKKIRKAFEKYKNR